MQKTTKINNYIKKYLLILLKFIYFIVIILNYLYLKLNFINIYERKIIYQRLLLLQKL